MKILIAEDDAVSRLMLETMLTKWGHEIVSVCDGKAAWQCLQGEAAPRLAILDWMMPEMDGVEVCHAILEQSSPKRHYIILLTAKGAREDIITGLQSGADDFITKPFDREELKVRLNVGIRILEMQQNLAEQVRKLEEALSRVKQLQGLLPICAWCKKIRDGQNYWRQVEEYVTSHSEATFSHGICPTCLKTFALPENP